MKKHKSGLALLTTLLTICLLTLGAGRGGGAEAVASAFVMPQINTIYDSVTLRGQVVEQGRQSVYPPGPCRVLAVHAKVGQTVAAGQTLLELETVGDSGVLGAALSRELQDAADSVLESGLEGLEQGGNLIAGAVAAGLLLEHGGLEAGQHYRVVSPIDGVVMAMAAVGDTLSGLLPAVQVSDMSKLALSASVGEGSVHLLEEGMDCTIQVDAVGTGTPLVGRIQTIMPYARQTGLLTQAQEVKTQVLVELTQAAPDLRPGYSATVNIVTGYAENSLTLPYEAIRQDESNREYVLVLEAGVAIQKHIRTGREMEACVQVTAGLRAEDLVLLEPALTHGQRVVAQ